jgi:hypothetical protein
MAIVTIGELKTYFETGDKPTEQQFVNLIDTLASLPAGGGSQTLAQTLVLGNTSGANDIEFDATQGLLFNNSSRLREGTTDAGLGGAKGVAQVCSLDYELKWEAGRLYVMEQTGSFIRQSLYNFTTTPTATDDTDKGYMVGSLWTLDDGTTYECTDATSTQAVWIERGIGTGILEISSTNLAALEGAAALSLKTIYIVTDATYRIALQAEAANKIGANGTIIDLTYSGSVYYDLATNTILNGTMSDIDGNTWNGCLPSATTLGGSSTKNTFNQGATSNLLGTGNYLNTFEQDAANNELGNNCGANTFKQYANGFIFGGGLQNVTIEANTTGANYTASPDYDFLYNNAYSATIFTDGSRNYHRYYEPANDRIVLRNLSTPLAAPTYIGGGIPDLQQVTDVGNATTNPIRVDDGVGNSSILGLGTLTLATGNIGNATIDASLVTDIYTAQLPDKAAGTETFAMLSDITAGSIPHAVAAGTDTYTATISGVTAYNDGDAYLIRFTNGNTTAATLDINGIGGLTPARLYRNNDIRVLGGDILDGAEMLCIYNSTLGGFQCIGTSPNSLFAYITNAESIAITKGQVVYAFGGIGDRMTVKLANNTADATSAKTIGVVVTSSIAANQKGIIITQGLLDTLSILPTATYADGDSIYLGATAGSITNVKPYAPNHLVYVGTVTTANNGTSGRMYVKIQNGYELDELHNVQAQSPTDKDTLYYDNTVSPPQWKTASIATISGLKAPIVSVGNGTVVTGTIAITICKTLALAANSRAVGDAPELFVQTTKTLINGTQFVRVYWNTSASLTGAILIASTGAAAASTLSQALIRHMGIEVANGGGNGTQIFQPISGANNPYVQTSSAIVAVAIDWTSATGFIIVSIQNGSILDSSNCNLISLK